MRWGPRTWERLEIVLSKYEIRIRISNVHYNLITVLFWSQSSIKKIAHPHSGKASSISSANRQTLRSSRGPYYEFIFTLGSCSFIVPRFPIPLVASHQHHHLHQRGGLCNRSSDEFNISSSSDQPTWSTPLDPKASQCLLQAGSSTEAELLRIITCSHSDPTRMRRKLLLRYSQPRWSHTLQLSKTPIGERSPRFKMGADPERGCGALRLQLQYISAISSEAH
jgi:hypothetical protein